MSGSKDAFHRLGFRLTPPGEHGLGSINHLAIFDDNYIELLGFRKNAPSIRADIASYPIGLNGLVFATADADSIYQELRRRLQGGRQHSV
jgi:Glyoxalase-like domain